LSDRRGAQIVVDYLVQQRVPYLFGVCGHGIIGLLDAAFERKDEISTITTHDERVAGFMADAFYRVAHKPVATYTSCGPGSLNLAMAVASAFQDSSAFMAITGNVPTQQFNRGPFQETGRYFQGDFASVMRPYVKRSYQAMRPEMLPLIMRQAFALMLTGRPGPVHVDIPLNVFVEETDAAPAEAETWRGAVSTPPAAEPGALQAALELLLEAERPLIVAGNGALLAGGRAELTALAGALRIPVITTPLGKGAIDETHELALGPTGRNGTFAANKAARSCDVLLAIGTRFDDRATSSWIPGVTYSIPPTKLIHVDVDPQEIGRNYPPELGILADGAVFLRQMRAAIGDRGPAAAQRNAGWVAATQEWKRTWTIDIEKNQRDDSDPIRPDRLVGDLGAVLPDDAIVLADVGIHHNWLLQQLKVPSRGHLLQSWGFASMGFGVGGALGAKFAAPDKPVLAVCGDGGFLMHSNAVATAVEYGLPIVWLVWNNQGYGSIYGQQRAFFGSELATRFRNESTGEPFTPDMAAMGRAMGADGAHIERPGDLKGQVAAALASGKPTVLEIMVDEYSFAAPATGTWDLPPLNAPAPTYGWDGDPSRPLGGGVQ
jgi:acetolactate synthase I/II/III large subunit